MIEEQYSIMAKEADLWMYRYMRSGLNPPAHLVEQSQYYMKKRINDYLNTGDVKLLLDYFGISTNKITYVPLISNKEEAILISCGVVPVRSRVTGRLK